MNRDFLKEAIADAKAVKESAIANAKAALEESFTPHLKTMLAAKLYEMEEKEMDNVKEEYDELEEAKEETTESEEGTEMEEGKEMEEGMKKKDELEEAYAALKTVKAELNEVNLLNAKLLYTNKIFRSKSLTESQKVKVLTAFDKAINVKEVKLVYESLLENLTTTKKPVNENLLSSASKTISGIKTQKQPIVESNEMVKRFQKLAGII